MLPMTYFDGPIIFWNIKCNNTERYWKNIISKIILSSKKGEVMNLVLVQFQMEQFQSGWLALLYSF